MTYTINLRHILLFCKGIPTYWRKLRLEAFSLYEVVAYMIWWNQNLFERRRRWQNTTTRMTIRTITTANPTPRPTARPTTNELSAGASFSSSLSVATTPVVTKVTDHGIKTTNELSCLSSSFFRSHSCCNNDHNTLSTTIWKRGEQCRLTLLSPKIIVIPVRILIQFVSNNLAEM